MTVLINCLDTETKILYMPHRDSSDVGFKIKVHVDLKINVFNTTIMTTLVSLENIST